MAYQSAGFTDAAWTRTRTSSSPASGRSISRSSSTSGGPNRSWTIAFMTSSSPSGVRGVGDDRHGYWCLLMAGRTSRDGD
jgi:hypothetical protein